MGAGPQVPRPKLADLVAAFAILTPTPKPRPHENSPAFARATLFFPLVGLGVGALLLLLQRIVEARPTPLVAAVMMVAVWTFLTWPTTRPLTPSIATRLVVIALLPTKVMLLAMMAQAQDAALLFAPLLGRWAIVVLAIGARDADHPGRKLNSSIAFRDFGWTSAATGAVLAWAGNAAGTIVFVATAAVVLGLRLVAHQAWSGFTWRSLCLAVHIIETLTIALVAALLNR